MTSQEFKARRHLIGWTQAQTSNALGVTIAQIGAIENGRSKVTATVEKLFSLYRPFDPPNSPTGPNRKTDQSKAPI